MILATPLILIASMHISVEAFIIMGGNYQDNNNNNENWHPTKITHHNKIMLW